MDRAMIDRQLDRELDWEPGRPQVVQLFDSWAHHLSPAQFAEFSLPYAQRVVDGVKAKYPNTPLIFHANGGERRAQRWRTFTVLVHRCFGRLPGHFTHCLIGSPVTWHHAAPRPAALCAGADCTAQAHAPCTAATCLF